MFKSIKTFSHFIVFWIVFWCTVWVSSSYTLAFFGKESNVSLSEKIVDTLLYIILYYFLKALFENTIKKNRDLLEFKLKMPKNAEEENPPL